MYFWGELPSKIKAKASSGLLLESIDCLAHPRVFLEVHLCYACERKKYLRVGKGCHAWNEKVIIRYKYPVTQVG